MQRMEGVGLKGYVREGRWALPAQPAITLAITRARVYCARCT
jgi:hypothetical protein